jgi:diamine N-acetyltransferase
VTAVLQNTVIDLRPVTPDTYQACVDLAVAPDQRSFVAPNIKSLAQAYVWPGSVARLIHADDEIVGFVLFMPADPPSTGQAIVRFMIDQRFQGRGLGRAALAEAVEWCRRERDAAEVWLCVVPENERARRLYRSAGFVETGDIREGEIVMVHRAAARRAV